MKTRESDLVNIMVKGAIVAAIKERNNASDYEAERVADGEIVNHSPTELQLRYSMGAALHALRKAGYRVVENVGVD